MAQVFVSIKNKSGNFEAQLMKDIQGIAARDVEKLAKKHEDVIKYTIENSMDGGTGNLESHWNAGEMNIPGKIAWGVGDIDELNREAPYYRHVNYGSVAIGANWQHILPKGRWVNGRWVESEDGYFAIPRTPVPARNYIEKSMLMMEPFIQQVLAEGRK
jgi:hypothetical protein